MTDEEAFQLLPTESKSTPSQQYHPSAHDDEQDLLELPEAQGPSAPRGFNLRIFLRTIVSQCITIITAALVGLIPSFISWFWRPKSTQTTVRSTAYLDGLRGGAAWAVFNGHLAAVLAKAAGAGFGFEGENWEIYKIPIIRVIDNGSFSVAIFFVISGFALSIAPILNMRKDTRDPTGFLKKLASATFRRPIRLFLPSYASTLFVFLLVRLDYFGIVQRNQPTYETLVDGFWNWSHWPVRFPTLLEQFSDWFVKALDFGVAYNGVLWTIQFEYRCSLALYLTHAAIYPMRKQHRTCLTLFLTFCLIVTGDWTLPLFWSGYLIAEYSQLTERKEEGPDLPRNPTTLEKQWNGISTLLKKRLHLLNPFFHWALLIVGLYFGSVPNWHPGDVAGYGWIVAMTPPKFKEIDRFWFGIGAVLVVFSISRIPVLVRFYSTALMQYAGRISFAFYLVHGPLVHGIGRVLFYYCWHMTSKDNGTSALVGFFMAYFVLLMITVWVADIFWRAVDEPLVRAALRLQNSLFTQIK